MGLLKKKKTVYKNGTKKGRECEGEIVLNGGKWNYYGKGEHTLYLNYIEEIISFLFLFLSFLI